MFRNTIKQCISILFKDTLCRFADYKVFPHLQPVPCMLFVEFHPFRSQTLIPQQLVLASKLLLEMGVLSACSHSLPMPMVEL